MKDVLQLGPDDVKAIRQRVSFLPLSEATDQGNEADMPGAAIEKKNQFEPAPEMTMPIGNEYHLKLAYFKNNIVRLVKSLFNGNIGGEFVDLMKNLIRGQIIDAHVKAWQDEGGDGAPPDYLKAAAESMIQDQHSFVEAYYKDIVDARVDKTSIEPLLSRADLWANRYNEAYNNSVQLITEETGGRLIWQLGQREEHCDTCAALTGIVATAKEWATSGFKPQNAPNPLLECGGWKCGCTLQPTKKRRSPRALDTLMNIASVMGGL